MNNQRGSRDKKKRLKRKSLSIDEDNSDSEENSHSNRKSSIHSRKENSLGELTKSFIKFVRESGRETININDIVKKLKVKKRRIYDITNVLEGIGYIKKHAKNEISWIKQDALSHDYDEMMFESKKEKQIKEYKELELENLHFDYAINHIKDLFNDISNKTNFNKYGYVTFEDLNFLSPNTKVDLLAIKAPKGTYVDIINPKEAKQAYLKAQSDMEKGVIERDTQLLDTLKKEHHIFLDSKGGEIVVYRITNEDYENCTEEGGININ